MSSIVKAFSDLASSIFEIFTSIIHTIFSFVQSVFAMGGSLVNEFVHLLCETTNFLFCRGQHVIKHLLKMVRVCTTNLIVMTVWVAKSLAYNLFSQCQT